MRACDCQPARLLFAIALVLAAGTLVAGQGATPAVVVRIQDGKLMADEAPVDPTPRIEARYSPGMFFGLNVEGTRITCTLESSVFAAAQVDNQIVQPGFDPNSGQPVPQQPLPPGPFGRKRLGSQTKWVYNNLHFTQLIEVIPSRLPSDAAAGQRRKLNAVRVTYLVENKDARSHQVQYRTFIDTMIANNDGALFASPTTAPGEILDGIVLENRTLPEYLQVLEKPDLKAPGFLATLTLRFAGKAEGPSRVVLTNTQAFNGAWDATAQKANGDSACFLYWPARTLKPGEKRTMVWAYGGGVASDTGYEDNMALMLSGSFAPGKLFTILATVDDPVAGQALTLELPAGMERVEGPARQPVPPQPSGTSAVLWKARVLRLGDFDLKVHSSTGVTQVKNISVKAAR